MINFFIGFLIVFGAVGGMETEDNLIASTLLAFIGLFMMYIGTSKFQR
jgi:hypothetical protein